MTILITWKQFNRLSNTSLADNKALTVCSQFLCLSKTDAARGTQVTVTTRDLHCTLSADTALAPSQLSPTICKSVPTELFQFAFGRPGLLSEVWNCKPLETFFGIQ